MDTALERLFKSMLIEGWFINSDGHVDSPQGFFGYVTNTEAELSEIYDAFSDIVESYGTPATEDIIGSFYASIDSNGIIHIYNMGNYSTMAKDAFDKSLSEYIKWNDSQPLEDA